MSDERENESASVRARRLQSILKKWTDAAPLSFFKTLPKADLLESGIPRDDLEKHGLIAADSSADNIPTQAGMNEMARILTRLFGNGKEIYREQLKRAVKDGMHGWNKSKSQFVTSQAIQWWRDNRSKTEGQIALAAEAEARRKINLAALSDIELAQAQRELDERWIQKDAAATTVTAAVLAHHAIVKKQFDKKFSGIVARHLSGEWTEEQLNRINIATVEAGREMMREIENECAAA
jgi:hypothetical protein